MVRPECGTQEAGLENSTPVLPPEGRMIVYRYFPDVDRFDAVVARGRAEKPLKSFKGEPLAATWTPVPVQLEAQSAGLGDFPALSGHTFQIPVLSERAWRALEPLVGPYVEVLPVACKAAPLVALNV